MFGHGAMETAIDNTNKETNKYIAFISYSHSDNRQEGRKWADWLHHELETYEVPADLVGSKNRSGDTIPAQIYPVFQDEKELSASANLSTALRQALTQSAHLVYLASPRSARSTYVAEEIRWFKQIGRADKIIALILDGDPQYGEDTDELQCFPEVLRYRIDENGAIDQETRQEPLAADVRLPNSSEQGYTSFEAYRHHLRQSKNGLGSKAIDRKVAEYKAQLDLAKLKIIAGLLDIPLGELTKRDQAYQLAKAQQRHRVVKRIAIVIGLLAIMAIILGIFAWNERNNAQQMLTRSLYLSGINKINESEMGEGAAYMAAASRLGNTQAAVYVQSMLMRQNGITPIPKASSAPVFSPNGRWLAVQIDASGKKQNLQIWDVVARRLYRELSQFDLPTSILNASMHFDRNNRLFFLNAKSQVVRWQDGNEAEIVYRPPAKLRIGQFSVSPDGNWLVLQGWVSENQQSGKNLTTVYSVASGKVVVESVPSLSSTRLGFERVLIAPDSRTVAFSNSENNSTKIRVYRFQTDSTVLSSEEYQLPIDDGRPVFDPESKSLFFYNSESLFHIRLDQPGGQPVSISMDNPIIAVYFNPDGKTAVAATYQQYTVFDRNTDRKVTSGTAPINFKELLPPEEDVIAPDLTQSTKNQQGVRNLITDQGPSLLRNQVQLGSDVVNVQTVPDSKTVLVLKKDGTSLDQWNLEDGKQQPKFIQVGKIIKDFGVSRKHDFVYTITDLADQRREVRFFQATTGTPLGQPIVIEGKNILLDQAGVLSSGRLSKDTMGIWEIQTGKRIREFALPPKVRYQLSQDFSKILTLKADGQWQIIDIKTGQTLYQERSHLTGASFIGEDRYLLAFRENKIDLYDMEDFKKRITIPTYGNVPKSDLSPDGKILAVAEDAKYIRLWDLEKKQAIGQKIKNDTAGKFLLFSKDGRTIFTTDSGDSGTERGIAIFDAATGLPVSMPFGMSKIDYVFLLQNEQRVVTLDFTTDQSILNIWDVPTVPQNEVGQLATLAETYYGKQYDTSTGSVNDLAAGEHMPASWFFQNPYSRPMLPGSKQTTADYLAKWVNKDVDANLRLLDKYWRFHPLARAAMADYFSRQAATGFVADGLIRMTELQLSKIPDEKLKAQTRVILDRARANITREMK